ncbi:MAG: M20/M25/M40 family metallo-hydrolase [Gammaproteobacteria bacterium]|nr:M20/M25/M40 family metallo-hydrolase [Gammaproteobacteria bacterium]
MTRILLLLTGLATAGIAQAQSLSDNYTKPYQRQALTIYRDTIAMNTSAGHHMVPTMAHYLADRFRDGGFDDEDIHVLLFQPPGGEETASLVVRYRGDGSAGKKPILFAGHMDVVGALRQDWVRDPFTLIEEDGYFFGRGTSDDKSGTTLLTAAFLRLKSEGFMPTRDLIIAFSGDEETAMATIRDLVASHRDLIDAEFAINADAGGGALDTDFTPIAYQLQAAEKTYVDFELIVRNPGGHSSRPQADNAIYRLADALKKVQAYSFPVRYNDITQKYFELRSEAESGEIGDAMLAFSRNPDDEDAAAILASYPSHVGVTRTTCVATMLDAGHAVNALPQTAKANINCRIFPGIAIAEVHTRLQEIIDDKDVEVAMIGNPDSAPASALREDVIDAISKAVHATYPDIPIIPSMSTGATDGRTLRLSGIPTYGSIAIFGRSEDSFAHGLNERVRVESFFDALEHWQVVIHELAGR